MRSFEIGVVLPIMQIGPDRTTTRWSELRRLALQAEAIGFDTIWTPDELLWRDEEGPPYGVWEGVAMAGAVAAVTSKAKVGTWVMSALHRNAGIIAKAAETLDEISGGRFVFGLGAGHAWPGQAHAFGLPEDQIFARFEEALQIIIPLLRGGHADFEGTWHVARDLPQQPVGPRPEQDPDPDRWQRPEGPTPRRSPCRHLELLRRGAGACRRARSAPRVARCHLRGDRARPVDDRPVCRRWVRPLAPAGLRRTSSADPPTRSPTRSGHSARPDSPRST